MVSRLYPPTWCYLLMSCRHINMPLYNSSNPIEVSYSEWLPTPYLWQISLNISSLLISLQVNLQQSQLIGVAPTCYLFYIVTWVRPKEIFIWYLEAVRVWLGQNGLKLNPNKTELMFVWGILCQLPFITLDGVFYFLKAQLCDWGFSWIPRYN